MKSKNTKEAPRPNSGAIYFEIDPRTGMIIVRGRWFGADGKAQALGFCKLPAWEQVPAAGTVMTQHLVRIVLDERRRLAAESENDDDDDDDGDGDGLDNEIGDELEDGDPDDDDDDDEGEGAGEGEGAREKEVHERILRGEPGDTWEDG